MTMIEHVARAIASKRMGCTPMPDVVVAQYIDAARAAITAMREPTEEMEAARKDKAPWQVWQAMIDAALDHGVSVIVSPSHD